MVLVIEQYRMLLGAIKCLMVDIVIVFIILALMHYQVSLVCILLIWTGFDMIDVQHVLF